jgi:cation transport ATPase
VPDLLFFLLVGHYVGDFALQTDRIADRKQRSTGALTLHVTIYTLTIAVFLALGLSLQRSTDFFRFATAYVLAFIFAGHWLQDRLKSRLFNGSKQAYYIDQSIHIIILFAIRVFIYNA